MSDTVIKVEALSKSYRLGAISGGTLRADFSRWLAKMRGKEDPNSKIAGVGSQKSEVRPPISDLRSPTSDLFWALRDVSFEVKQGEILGVIGRNGAGKSTLLKILSRVTAPSSGQVKIKGRIASLLEVGTGFHPELTGRENIFLNGAILGMSKSEIKNKLDEIVDFSGVEQHIDTPVKRYSSGMYVRLAFAVAAHLEPEILILDEVLAVGDAEFQKKCLGKMKDVAGHGRTVLFVSHNMQSVATLTNKALLMAAGQKQFIGGTSEAIGHYMAEAQSDSLFFSDEKHGTEPKIIFVKMKTSLEGNVHIHSDPLQIEIRINTPIPINGACVSIQIFDSSLINYLHVWTHDVNLAIWRKPGTYILNCLIPKLRLYMGRYRLRVFFSEPPGGQSFKTLDGICPFEVIMQNTHRLFQWWPNECAYLEECQWNIHAVNNE